MTASPAVDAPPPGLWCNSVHPLVDLVICRKLRHPREVLHNSRNVPDWIDPSPTSTEENQS